MEHDSDQLHPRTATDEPVLSSTSALAAPVPDVTGAGRPGGGMPDFATEAEKAAWWKGVVYAASNCRPAEPDEPDEDLGFPGPVTPNPLGLVTGMSDRLSAAPAPAGSRFTRAELRRRHDGWTPERRALFLDVLASCGVVADAVRMVGLSAQSAYALRGRREGRAFAFAWEIALRRARGRMADEVASRALNGVVDRTFNADGELVRERHHFDNRLTMAVLTRLDHAVENEREEALHLRAVGEEFEALLDLIEADGDAEAFIEARRPEPFPPPAFPDLGDTELMARITALSRYREVDPRRITCADLDVDEMDTWSDDQWERAWRSGFLKDCEALLGAEDEDEGEDEAAGEEQDALAKVAFRNPITAERARLHGPTPTRPRPDNRRADGMSQVHQLSEARPATRA